MNGWAKFHRKIKKWEWYSDSQTFHLFFHLVISANHAPAKWQGVELLRGQLASSVDKISAETGISIRAVRTCQERLKKCGELTIKTTNKFSVYTVVNYDEFQKKKTKPTSESTNDRQTNDNQSTTNNKNKNENKKEESPFIPQGSEGLSLKFGEFYSAYPKKEDRARAEALFVKLLSEVQNPTELADQIIRAAQAVAVDYAADRSKFAKSPFYWLEGRGWEDKPLPPVETEEQKRFNFATGCFFKVRVMGHCDAMSLRKVKRWVDVDPTLETRLQEHAKTFKPTFGKDPWSEFKRELEKF